MIQGQLGVEPPLLQIERSLLRCFSHLISAPPEHLPLEVSWACLIEKRPQDRPRTFWRDYASSLTWDLRISQEELKSVTGERDVRVFRLDLLPPLPDHELAIEDKWVDYKADYATFLYLLIFQASTTGSVFPCVRGQLLPEL